MARHRLAIIGLGMAVPRHAESLLDLKDRVEVAGAFSPSTERRQSFAERFPFPLTERLDAILGNRSIGIVSILTPPSTHLELVHLAADAKKHILLEKPLDITTARAEALVETCRKAHVKLAVMLQHRFRPASIKLAELVRAGELGKIVGCSTMIRLWRPQSYYDEPGRGSRARDGGGVLLTQAIHTLDLMLSLAGPVAEVTAYATTTPVHRMETEDMVSAAARFESGALGVIDATTAAFPGFPEKIEIAGEKATALLTGTELKVLFHDGRKFEIEADKSAGGTGANPMAFPHDYHRSLYADFFDAIEQNREPKVSGTEALRVHRLIDAILESSAAGKPVRIRS